MKLFYIANARIPTEKAHGAQIMAMCEAFARLGLEVELVVPRRKNQIQEDAFDFYGIERLFKIKKVFSLNPPSILGLGLITLHSQNISFALGVFLNVLFNPNKYSADSIFYFRDRFSPWLLVLLNRKVFIEFHAFRNHFRTFKFLFPRLGGMILITQKAKEEFINLGIKEEKIFIAPDGVNLNKFDIDISGEEARERTGLPINKKIIGYTGSFATMGEDKGLNDIFSALKLLGEGIDFLAVGGSEKDIEKYRKIAVNMGIEEKIILLGHVNQSELAVYQKACDCLLMPFPAMEHYIYYMSPLKMFEYMASKRPIIATNLLSIREVLNEKNAIIVEPDNPESLSLAIKNVLEDKDLSAKISERAFQEVKKYSWEKRVEGIMEFIKTKL
jgi:glycosyltransferase involved in cell wall biosynthesis